MLPSARLDEAALRIGSAIAAVSPLALAAPAPARISRGQARQDR